MPKYLGLARDSHDWSSMTEAELERVLRGLAEQRAVKPAVLIHGTRLAVTGRMVSPGLFEMVRLVGQEAVLRRLEKLASVLPPAPSAVEG